MLGTFHDSVIFLDQKQNLCAPAVGKLSLQTQDFSRGFAATCLEVQRCSIIIYGRNLKCIIITLVKAGGCSATIRNF